MPIDRRASDIFKGDGAPWYKTTGGRLTFILMVLWLSVVLNVVTTVRTNDGIGRQKERSCLIIDHFDIPDPKRLCR